MRRGFSMIELIFVIVIIGILAAVAIPKLTNTSTEAKKAKVTSWVGSLNRTVGPTMWAESIGVSGGTGSIIAKCANIANYIDVIPEVTMAADCNLSITGDLSGAKASWDTAHEAFTDGTKLEAPKWDYAF